MNITQIEHNISKLLNNFSEKSFIYDFLLAYGTPKNTITLLKNGKRNLSNRDDQIILKKKIFFQEIFNDDPHDVIDNIFNEKITYRHEPRFIIVTNYKELLAIDIKTNETLDSSIKDLTKDFVFFLPLAGMEKTQLKNENPADVKAAERMAKIYDEILKDNKFETKEELHGLNIFLSRLLFCYFAEDTGIFEEAIFTNSISSYTQIDGSDLDIFFYNLFDILNKEESDRQAYPAYLNNFPYVNGGLFHKKHFHLKFSTKSRKMMIESGTLDWSEINPDIFGSMIQAVVHPEQRGGFGMHYTSVPNIMKVIEPLFLNDLKSEFKKNFDSETKLERLLVRLANIQIFDPACGSGNFLIISYKEIRKLEMAIFKRLQEISSQKSLPFSWISLSQFYGIELDDFACEIAILSLWLAEHQMNLLFKDTFGQDKPFLPLKNGGNIMCGNSARIEWDAICPKNVKGEVYILGNPPYLGSSLQDEFHKEDMDFVFKGISGYKNLDYISCWFFKGAKYIFNTSAKLAFVSTNSICQGEQVSLLWPQIFKLNLEINFAHLSFKWSNNAKSNAGVICCIVGLRNIEKNKPKSIYNNDTQILCENISPYLTKNKSIIVYKRSKPISKLPPMTYGSKPVDGGNLILSEDERNELIASDKRIEKFIKAATGSIEFIRGIKRYCLWIEDYEVEEALLIPLIAERIERVRELRLKSSKQSTVNDAIIPHKFSEVRYNNSNSIIIPRVSSDRRNYLPIGFLAKDTVILDSAQAIYNAEPFVFGVLASKIHLVWVRATAGRLKSDYRYSSALCYNTFPIPDLTDKQKESVTFHVYNILEEREKYPEKTISDLYDPVNMPDGLIKAHHDLDAVIDLCYRSKIFIDDEERLEFLLKLYEDLNR
ncbi:class I SAM-dependent DNA methyltransferase [Fluoribacter dumoffii]|uniref:class I SAM-dependent DNA methyltransferase n=1 Tax=Fluoribacter dumoffii TaxID=463 RepID=UPI00026C770E|nr:DNA methyltransferase [Fluoribacter dumoffii]